MGTPTGKEVERAIDGLVMDGRVERFVSAAGEPSIRLLKRDKPKLTNDAPQIPDDYRAPLDQRSTVEIMDEE